MESFRKLVAFSLLCLCLDAETQAHTIVCKEGWEKFEGTGSCYFISGNEETWHDAMDLCARGGGHLARINSRVENEYLKQRARSTGGDVWVDGTDEDQEGTWIYGSTRGPIGFTDWHSGEPSAGAPDADCLILLRDFNYKWDDNICTRKNFFICEMEPEIESCPRCSCCCGH